ncbi:MAG TPA: hypothetical protein DCX14_07020 [Flavobacteriales bacterium]|nr:DUF4293 domain-containing protein [Flavobacteriales bacterium]MDB9701717.1 DUF4293 domain-containing protein [Salibacteraceae bacterium]HAW19916.1 hypothetical protein [Flavobacteriales bacterium]
MIQRIQSVYILVAIALQGLSLILNWSTYIADDTAYYLSGLNTSYDKVDSSPLTLGILLSLALIIVTLFVYKNRSQQLRIANVSIIQLVVTLGLFSWVHYQCIEALKVDFSSLDIGYGIAVVFPIISGILIWLAKKAIKKDDDLIKSVDRLR